MSQTWRGGTEGKVSERAVIESVVGGSSGHVSTHHDLKCRLTINEVEESILFGKCHLLRKHGINSAPHESRAVSIHVY